MAHPGLRRLQPLRVRELGPVRRLLLRLELLVQLHDEAAGLARIAALNAVAAAAAEAGGVDRIRRVIKLVGFVASDPAFTGQPAVVNGASVLLGEIFGTAGAHARSAVGVAVLPLDTPVELELVVEVVQGRG